MIKVILFITLLLGLIYLMVRSQRLETWWRQRREASQDEPSRFGRFRERTTQQLQATWQRLRPERPQPPTPEALATWATTAIELDRETAVWFSTLSPDHLAVLTQFVDEFCASMGFELNWLLNGQVAENPELAATLTAVVQHYLQACRLTFAVREDLLAFTQPDNETTAENGSRLAAARAKIEQSVKTKLKGNGHVVQENNDPLAAAK